MTTGDVTVTQYKFSPTLSEYEKADGYEPTMHDWIYQAIGAASTAWFGGPTGVFDSTQAADIGDALMAEIQRRYVDPLDQCQTQLAGVSVVATGALSEPLVVHRDMYGWSHAYRDVKNLRLAYEAQRDLLAKIKADILITRQYIGEDSLPEVEGWHWFEAVTSIDKALETFPGDYDDTLGDDS